MVESAESVQQGWIDYRTEIEKIQPEDALEEWEQIGAATLTAQRMRSGAVDGAGLSGVAPQSGHPQATEAVWEPTVGGFESRTFELQHEAGLSTASLDGLWREKLDRTTITPVSTKRTIDGRAREWDAPSSEFDESGLGLREGISEDVENPIHVTQIDRGWVIGPADSRVFVKRGLFGILYGVDVHLNKAAVSKLVSDLEETQGLASTGMLVFLMLKRLVPMAFCLLMASVIGLLRFAIKQADRCNGVILKFRLQPLGPFGPPFAFYPVPRGMTESCVSRRARKAAYPLG